MKTYRPTAKDFHRKTYLVDADGRTLGRLATHVARLLMGKDKPVFAYDQWTGDQVVVINAEKVYVTGKKPKQKVYTHYTGWPSGLKTYTYERLKESKPEEIIRRAVSRMLPKNKLGKKMAGHLRVYKGSEHRHQAQKPIPEEIA